MNNESCSGGSEKDTDLFEIGGEYILKPAQSLEDAKEKGILDDIRIRLGTLLKTETVSFLLGAGASVDCGGPLIGSIPLELEKILLENGIKNNGTYIEPWLKVFYVAVRSIDNAEEICPEEKALIDRLNEIKSEKSAAIRVNVERLLSILWNWSSVLSGKKMQLLGDGKNNNKSHHDINITADDVNQAISEVTHALAFLCDLPKENKKNELGIFKTFISKLLTRPLNLRRVNIFSLNYDSLVEQAADAKGVVLLDGFVGSHRRIFRPESYEHDLYFPAETTEGRVHRLDRVIHLYKLHGSITWVKEEADIDNPYGIISKPFDPKAKVKQELIIYPTPTKYGEVLGMPYAEMFRRFAHTIVRPQSVLFVIGYGFGDDHVNTIIRQALAIPSFVLVIVDPKPVSDFVINLRAQKDQRVWIASGPTIGKFKGFVEQLLPDLHEEYIRQKVVETWKSLHKKPDHSDGGEDV